MRTSRMLPKHLTGLNIGMSKNLFGPNNIIQICSFLKNSCSRSIRRYNSASAFITEEKSRVFLSAKAQNLMKTITGLDLEKIYAKRTTAKHLRSSSYEFMTDEQLKAAQRKAVRKAYIKLQMPPLIPVNKGEVEVLDENPEMIGFTKSNYVFTDISVNESDKKRLIVVRQPDGVLRKALPNERHRMNQLYFPRPGRSYEHPKMFQKENLRRLLDQRQYTFVLDRACAQFEPDDEEFHDTLFLSFDVINEKKDFDQLRSTRHFGPMVFYLCLTRNIGKLIEENLETERLEDAYIVAQLYCLIHSDCKFLSLAVNPDNRIEYLQKFIESECAGPEKSLQLLETYLAVEKNPMHTNVD